MFARTSLILTLVLSLLFVTQAQPMALPVEMKPDGMCAGMQCARGCCANSACCTLSEQKQAPLTPLPPSQQHFHVQLATIGLRAYTLLFIPPARVRPLVILDEAGIAHTLSPLAVSCIQLI
jgi:hypothetical protein